MNLSQSSYVLIFHILCGFISTILVVLLFAFAAYGVAIAYADTKIDAGHVSELSFYVGVLANGPLWLAGTWTSAIAFAVGSRPLFKWAGLGFFVLAAAVFFLMFAQRPDFQGL